MVGGGGGSRQTKMSSNYNPASAESFVTRLRIIFIAPLWKFKHGNPDIFFESLGLPPISVLSILVIAAGVAPPIIQLWPL